MARSALLLRRTNSNVTRVPVTLAASGTAAAVTAVTGSSTIVGGAQTLAASGTVAVVAATSGNAVKVGGAPTFVAKSDTVWNTTTTPKTASVTVQTGDILTVFGAVSTGASATEGLIATPTGGGLTYTLRQQVDVAAYSQIYVWTAPATSNATFSVSATCAGTGNHWGLSTHVWRGSAGVGASAKTNVANGAPSLALTTSFANSAVCVVNADWNPVDGASRTWRQVNSVSPVEQTYSFDTGWNTTYVAYHADAGAAGSKTVGLSAPAGQKYSIVAIEIRGT